MFFYISLTLIATLIVLSQKINLLILIPIMIIFRWIRSKKIILLISLLLSCYFDYIAKFSIIGREQPQSILYRILKDKPNNMFIVNLGSFVLSIAFTLLVVHLIKKINISHFKRLALFIGISLVVIYCFSELSKQSNSSYYLLLPIIIFFKLFSLWLLFISYNDFYIERPIDILYMIPPIWDTSVSVRPEIKILESNKTLRDLDREALKITLLFFSFVLIYLFFKYLFFENIFYGYRLSFLPILDLNIFKYIQNKTIPSVAVSLFMIFSYGVLYIFGYLAWVSAVDACYRLLGFEPSRQFFSPLKSKSVAEFFFRAMPYYSYSLNFIFVFPLYRKLRQIIKDKKICYDIALFVGIISYNYIFHLTLDISYFMEYSFASVLLNQFHSIFVHSIYIFVLVRFISRPKKMVGWYFQTLFILFIIFNFGILLIIRLLPMQVSIHEKILFLKSIF